MCGFIAQLVEHSTGIAEVTGMVAYRYHSKFAKDFTKKLFN